jgi:hypothetical protein
MLEVPKQLSGFPFGPSGRRIDRLQGVQNCGSADTCPSAHYSIFKTNQPGPAVKIVPADTVGDAFVFHAGNNLP